MWCELTIVLWLLGVDDSSARSSEGVVGVARVEFEGSHWRWGRWRRGRRGSTNTTTTSIIAIILRGRERHSMTPFLIIILIYTDTLHMLIFYKQFILPRKTRMFIKTRHK